LYENARSALDCGRQAAAPEPVGKAVAGATAVQGAFGTVIFMAARDLALLLRINSAKNFTLRILKTMRDSSFASLRACLESL
jgi:hypothetical protein